MKKIIFGLFIMIASTASKAQNMSVHSKISHFNNHSDTTFFMGNDEGYVDQVPTFNGDVEEYIKSHSKYYSVAKQDRNKAVEVDFMVDEHGHLSNVHTDKSVDANLADQAIKLVSSMPAWKPAMLNNKPKKVAWFTYVRFE